MQVKTMISLLDAIKAIIICAVLTSIYTLYTSTVGYQLQLAGEGIEAGKIEALLHYSSLMDVLSRMFSGWLHLFVLSFISCLLLMLWLKVPRNNQE